jgi:hypothetical protein
MDEVPQAPQAFKPIGTLAFALIDTAGTTQ